MAKETIQKDVSAPAPQQPFTHQFWDKELGPSRKAYMQILFGGSFAVVIMMFAVLSIYWGALWKTPVRNLQGWVVDFDGGVVGHSVVSGLTAGSSLLKVTFTPRPASDFPGGASQVVQSVRDHHTWVAVVVNPGSSSRLQTSISTPNVSYSGSDAITVYASEARNENAFRLIIRPSVQGALDAASKAFALRSIPGLLSSSNITNLLTVSPQTVLLPISYSLVNLVPFDHPVATATTFVGLIYVLILSFFVVMISHAAREASGMEHKLTLRSLILTRFGSTFVGYFFISLFYSLVSLAFQLDFSRKFGHGGFVLFWMLNWVGMLAVGLALESMLTILTARFIPFFLLTWLIINVSVFILPIEVLPIFYRYGYSMPFYNINHAVRTIVFGTKNEVGQNFGILLAWVFVSCISLPLFQWYVRRREVAAVAAATPSESEEGNELKKRPSSLSPQ